MIDTTIVLYNYSWCDFYYTTPLDALGRLVVSYLVYFFIV
jgi:hypothetical protein